MGRQCLKKTSKERKFDDWPVASQDADSGVLVWGPGVPIVRAFQMTLMGIYLDKLVSLFVTSLHLGDIKQKGRVGERARR